MRKPPKADLFNAFRDVKDERRIIGVYDSDKELTAYSLNVDPKAMSVVMESVQGWDLQEIGVNSTLHTLLEICDSIRTEFKIKSINRAGLRVFAFSTPLDTFSDVASSFRNSYSRKVTELVERTLGEVSDYSWIFDGNNADGLSYKFRVGPYQSVEASRFLQEFAEQFSTVDTYTSILDLDIFEKDFEFPSGSSRKWSRAIFERAVALSHELGTTITQLRRGQADND